MASQPIVIRTWVVGVLAVVATLAPLALGALGLTPAVLTIEAGRVALPIDAYPPAQVPSIATLTIYAVALIALATAVGKSQEDKRREARIALEIQAWKLRQLLPRGARI